MDTVSQSHIPKLTAYISCNVLLRLSVSAFGTLTEVLIRYLTKLDVKS